MCVPGTATMKVNCEIDIMEVENHAAGNEVRQREGRNGGTIERTFLGNEATQDEPSSATLNRSISFRFVCRQSVLCCQSNATVSKN